MFKALTPRQIWYINAVLAIIALWLSYKIWVTPRQDAWHFIPDNAFLVIESSKVQASLYDKNDSVVTAISTIPFLYDAIQHVNLLTTDLDDKQKKAFLSNKLVSYSLHREAKRNLEYIVYIPLRTSDDEEMVEVITNKKAPNKRIFNQTTKAISITRISRENEENDFSFFVYDDFLIGSRSVVLLEAVISKIKSRTPALDKVPFKESRQGYAHLYFRTRNLMDISDLLPSELSPNLRSYFRNITPFNPDLVINKVLDNEHIEGYVASNLKIDVPFLSAFGLQKASTFESAALIPDNTSFFIRTSFDEGSQIGINLNVYLKKKDTEWLSKKDSASKLIGKDITQLLSSMNKEAIFCEMETVAEEPSQKIALFYSTTPEKLIGLFDDYATAAERFLVVKSQPFSLFNRVVRKIDIAELPAMLFGSTFGGFSECYYTLVNNHLVIANGKEAMESYLSKLSIGQTWKTSTVHQDLLKKLNKNAQITVVISPQRIWNNLYYSLPKRWQEAVTKHEQRFKNMRLIAVENFVHREQFGTKIHIHKNSTKQSPYTNQLLLQEAIEVGQTVQSQPFIINNPTSRKEEVLIQTATGLQLFDAEGKKVSSVPIEGQLLSTFIPFDFNQNGKIQYLFQTTKKVYVIERTADGLSVKNPAIPISGEIKALAVEPGKIYVADASGRVFKVTNEGSISQIPIKSVISNVIDIQLFSYKNINYIVLLQREGSLQLFYENNGIPIRNFPIVPLNTRPSKVMIENDPQGKPFFKLISEVGEIKTVTLEGNVLTEAQQLERKSKDAIFSVITDQHRRNWLIVQRDPTGMFIYDKKGNQLLTIGTAGGFVYNELKVSYFDLGNDWRILCIFDGKNNLFYDLRGNQFGDKLLPAAFLPALSYEDTFNKILIYNALNVQVEKWGIKVH